MESCNTDNRVIKKPCHKCLAFCMTQGHEAGFSSAYGLATQGKFPCENVLNVYSFARKFGGSHS